MPANLIDKERIAELASKAAGLDKEDPSSSQTKPMRQNAAGRARTDNNVVVGRMKLFR